MSHAREIFAHKMEQLRNGRPYRQFSKDIQDKTGYYISFTTLHDYEKINGQEPKHETIDILAKYADVKPSWFFEDMQANEPPIPYAVTPADQVDISDIKDEDIQFIQFMRRAGPQITPEQKRALMDLGKIFLKQSNELDEMEKKNHKK